MQAQKVRTRFAPSPTGKLHIGGARAALYAYLWAKKNQGDFILRIEDTDKEREVAGSMDNIIEGLHWLGIYWEEGPDIGGEYGPYLQSERKKYYAKYIQELLDSNKAYRCFCTAERLVRMRKEQQKKQQAPQYDGTCKNLSPDEVKKQLDARVPFAVRLSIAEEGTVVVPELLRGDITFELKDIDDQVLIKSDRFPTYHFANVVDDHLMNITHVIRGEEWIPSTPKHVLLYQAFGWEIPVFAHLPLFLSKSGGKMSKREGETALLAFRDLGYLPQAVVNFSAFLGWNPKTEEEFFTIQELIDRFELTTVHTSNAVFDREKLDWMNQQYVKHLSIEDVLQYIQELCNVARENKKVYQKFYEWFSILKKEKQDSVWANLQERSKTLLEVARTIDIVQGPVPQYDPNELIWKKSDKKTTQVIFKSLIEHLENVDEKKYVAKELENEIISWIKTTEWGNGDVLWPMRFALSGEQKSPSPFELAALCGKEETVRRMKKALELL